MCQTYYTQYSNIGKAYLSPSQYNVPDALSFFPVDLAGIQSESCAPCVCRVRGVDILDVFEIEREGTYRALLLYVHLNIV